MIPVLIPAISRCLDWNHDGDLNDANRYTMRIDNCTLPDLMHKTAVIANIGPSGSVGADVTRMRVKKHNFTNAGNQHVYWGGFGQVGIYVKCNYRTVFTNNNMERYSMDTIYTGCCRKR
jgi:hypothetical protein